MSLAFLCLDNWGLHGPSRNSNRGAADRNLWLRFRANSRPLLSKVLASWKDYA